MPEHGFCSQCWKNINFISKPFCHICGFPFEYDMKDTSGICKQCIYKKPAFDKAVASVRYDDYISPIIASFKYYDKTAYAKIFSSWIMRSTPDLIKKSDIIAPVPLHKLRLLKRKYNQSALLAKHIHKQTGKYTIYDLLYRTKHTRPQVGLEREKRMENVRGVFDVKPKYMESIQNKKILLIDDVTTTGATLDACASALKIAGARKVYAATVAKTAHEL